jgi:hypothetical protein
MTNWVKTVPVLSVAICVGLLFGCKTTQPEEGSSDVKFSSPTGASAAMPSSCGSHIPGGEYSQQDIATEQKYCGLDFDNHNLTVCPKTNSTSAALNYFTTPGCADNNHWWGTMKFYHLGGSLVNPSGLALYYHLSRFIKAHAFIPVTSFREITGKDQAILRKAASDLSGRSESWKTLSGFLKTKSRLVTAPDGTPVGVFVTRPGKRYGPIINSLRKAAWGKAQTAEWGRTPSFLGLRSSGSFSDGVKTALAAVPNFDRNENVSSKQMAFWMAEMLDVAILDYIIGQQDRVGNIDYLTVTREGETFKQTILQDSDGSLDGGQIVKDAGVLDGIVHYTADHYRGILDLDHAMQSGSGEVYHFIATDMRMLPENMKRVKDNTASLAAKLRSLCANGSLKLDVDPEAYMSGQSTSVDCKTMTAASTPISESRPTKSVAVPAEPEEISEMDQDSRCTLEHGGMCSDRSECLAIGRGATPERGVDYWQVKYRNGAALLGNKDLDHRGGLGCPGGVEVKCCYPKGK